MRALLLVLLFTSGFYFATAQSNYTFNEIVGAQTYVGKQTERSVPQMLIKSANSLVGCYTDYPYLGTTLQRSTEIFRRDSNGVWNSSTFPFNISSDPNIDALNGWDYIMATTQDSGMILFKSPSGSGVWSTTFPTNSFNMFTGQNDQWCRMAVGGLNGQTIHVIVNSQGFGTGLVINQKGPLTYSRSSDGGVTWDIDHMRLPMSDESFFLGFNRGNYAIDSRGDVVAVVAGGFDADLCLWKSVDNGTTWSRTVIYPCQIPLYDDESNISDVDADGVADTIFNAGQDPAILIDENNLVHVTVGQVQLYDNDLAGKARMLYSVDGLLYWNENLNFPITAVSAEDFNQNGVIDLPTSFYPDIPPVGAYFGGLLLHPFMASDYNGTIYISYSALNEAADTLTFQCAHRHCYIISTDDNGVSFSVPEQIMAMGSQGGNGDFEEGVYTSLVREVDSLTGDLDLMYFRDGAPYFADSLLPAGPLYIQELWNVDASGLPLVLDVVYVTANRIAAVGELDKWKLVCSPSPSSDFIILNGWRGSDLPVEIINIDGRLMKSTTLKQLDSSISISEFANGIYLLKAEKDATVYTTKFLVQH